MVKTTHKIVKDDRSLGLVELWGRLCINRSWNRMHELPAGWKTRATFFMTQKAGKKFRYFLVVGWYTHIP